MEGRDLRVFFFLNVVCMNMIGSELVCCIILDKKILLSFLVQKKKKNLYGDKKMLKLNKVSYFFFLKLPPKSFFNTFTLHILHTYIHHNISSTSRRGLELWKGGASFDYMMEVEKASDTLNRFFRVKLLLRSITLKFWKGSERRRGCSTGQW